MLHQTNMHELAFTSLRTVTHNSVTPGRLQTVESAVHSVWDTHTCTSLSDTAMSASVWASGGGHTETTTKLAFSQQNHYIIQSLFNRHRSDLTVDRHLLYSHCEQETSVHTNEHLLQTHYTTHHSRQQSQCVQHYTRTYIHTHTILHRLTIS